MTAAKPARQAAAQTSAVFRQLVAEGRRILGADDFVMQSRLDELQEVEGRSKRRRGGVGEVEAARAVRKTDKEVIEVSEQPAALDPDGVAFGYRRSFANGELIGQIGEIYAGGDREAPAPPEPPVDFDEIQLAGAGVLLELQHRDPVPAKRAEQPDRVVAQPWI